MKGKVLMVDDERSILKIVELKFRKQIKSGELSFVFADSFNSALDIVSNDINNDIKIVVSDINMGKHSGFDLCETFKKNRNDLVMYICSAYDRADYREKASLLNIKRYFSKPLDFRSLELAIHEDMT